MTVPTAGVATTRAGAATCRSGSSRRRSRAPKSPFAGLCDDRRTEIHALMMTGPRTERALAPMAARASTGCERQATRGWRVGRRCSED
jgi:hypothetical protein